MTGPNPGARKQHGKCRCRIYIAQFVLCGWLQPQFTWGVISPTDSHMSAAPHLHYHFIITGIVSEAIGLKSNTRRSAVLLRVPGLWCFAGLQFCPERLLRSP